MRPRPRGIGARALGQQEGDAQTAPSRRSPLLRTSRRIKTGLVDGPGTVARAAGRRARRRQGRRHDRRRREASRRRPRRCSARSTPTAPRRRYFFQYRPDRPLRRADRADRRPAPARRPSTSSPTSPASRPRRPTTTGSSRTNRFGITRGARPHVQDQAAAARAVARRDARTPCRSASRPCSRGTLSGTGNASRQVVLQSNPFPYTQGFANTTNVQLTGRAGRLRVPAAVGAGEHAVPRAHPDQAGDREPDRHRRRRASGSARRSPTRACAAASACASPARSSRARAASGSRSRSSSPRAGSRSPARPRTARAARRRATSKRIRIARGGSYRVFVASLDGSLASSTGRTVKIRIG